MKCLLNDFPTIYFLETKVKVKGRAHRNNVPWKGDQARDTATLLSYSFNISNSKCLLFFLWFYKLDFIPFLRPLTIVPS